MLANVHIILSQVILFVCLFIKFFIAYWIVIFCCLQSSLDDLLVVLDGGVAKW